MKALILAAGRGTRLRPITDYVPKPMLPLHGRPLMEWALLPLLACGIRDYVIAVSTWPNRYRIISARVSGGE